MRAVIFVSMGFAVLLGTTGAAWAEEPASGTTVQIRMPVTTFSSLASTALGNPQFLIGRRTDHGGLGVGLGFSRFGWHSESSGAGYSSESSSSGTLFQVSPAAWFDCWKSPDGTTVGNVLVMAGYGRASIHTENSYSSPGFSGGSDDTHSGNVVGFGAGLGGDHFLSPNFSLGVEAGFQGAVVFGFEPSTDVKTGVSTLLTYAALRASIVY